MSDFFNKENLDERIKALEEKSSKLEEKVNKLIDVLESLEENIEGLHETLLNKSNTSQFKESAPFDERYLPPCRLNMDNNGRENKALTIGWYPSEGKFRWIGKDKRNAEIWFKVQPHKDYELALRIFAPKIIVDKPIKILANDVELSTITAKKEEKIETAITIPYDLIKANELKIRFKSPFWIPKELDPNVKDTRTLSIAFDYLELREV